MMEPPPGTLLANLLAPLTEIGPEFYWFAIPAVMLTGLSKGGLGGALAMLGTPMLAIAVSPVKAAAIMLPILILMDMISLYSHWGHVKKSVLKATVPGAIVGIGIGWATASVVSDPMIKIIVGLIALAFGVNQLLKELRKITASPERPLLGALWGVFAGFTSFVSHAGGPPFQAYTVPLKMEARIFVGTSVAFFTIINAIKVIPYFALGQFSPENLALSASLIPFAIVGVLLGVWGVRRISQTLFYHITYAAMLIIGTKLVYDGWMAL